MATRRKTEDRKVAISRNDLVGRGWRVDPVYRGADKSWNRSTAQTVAQVRAYLGEFSDNDECPLVVQPGDRLPAGAREIITEDGHTLEAPVKIDASIPPGYHYLVTQAGEKQSLIVSPGTCTLPDKRRWGLAVQLYAARSASSWGIGDTADLHTIEQWGADRGAGFVLINPLHATPMRPPVQASPYFPSSRLWRNPLYLHIEDIPGAPQLGADLEPLARAGRDLNNSHRIDRDQIALLKLSALEKLWKIQTPNEEFVAYRQSQGIELENYARYSTLADVYGPQWSTWPADLQNIASAAVEDFSHTHQDETSFHCWLQYLMYKQLTSTQTKVRVMHDLAIGADRHGADTWTHPHLYAMDYSLGAPPDEFTTLGQDWGTPPMHPGVLQKEQYQPFIRLLRSGFASGGALRFDHVIGLFRLWWIPVGAGPFAGTYVRYPARDLLNILALESSRSEGWVVGEALGTVEAGVRPELSRRNVLAYDLLAREGRTPAQHYPESALTVVLTHDHPTLVGLWDGSDLQEQIDLNREPNVAGTEIRRRRVAWLTGLPRDAPVEEVVEQIHRCLAQAPSLLLAASLSDIAVQVDRSNLPGTTDEIRANWRIPLPSPLEQVLQSPLAESVATELRRA